MTAEEKKKHRQEQIERREALKENVTRLHKRGFSNSVIAGMIGMPESTVRAILSNK